MSTDSSATTTATATFAAGCFWGIEAEFNALPGVIDAVSGYTGGHTEHPTYREVCTGATGHAEAVEVIFDPKRITYDELLAVFWAMHDPTTVNRQGPDVGSQYRSAIFYHDDAQRARAEATKASENASGRHRAAIVTEIVPATKFYAAEEYHQRYFKKNGIAVH